MADLTLDALTTQVVARAASDDSLDRLDAAIAVAVDLDRRSDALVDHFVAAARSAGRSWTEIGGRLGVSKQAARKRFPAPPAPPLVLPPGVRLQPSLQTCLTEAERYAEEVGAGEISTEHLLAGLLAAGTSADILNKLGVSVEAITASARRLFSIAQPADERQPPLSAEAVGTIEAAAHRATAASLDQADVAVGPEHLLAVLALDPGSRARRVLTDLGVDIALIKKELACYTGVQPRQSRRFGRRRRSS